MISELLDQESGSCLITEPFYSSRRVTMKSWLCNRIEFLSSYPLLWLSICASSVDIELCLPTR